MIDLKVVYTDQVTGEELCFLHAVGRALIKHHPVKTSVEASGDYDLGDYNCAKCTELREQEERDEEREVLEDVNEETESCSFRFPTKEEVEQQEFEKKGYKIKTKKGRFA